MLSVCVRLGVCVFEIWCVRWAQYLLLLLLLSLHLHFTCVWMKML